MVDRGIIKSPIHSGKRNTTFYSTDMIIEKIKESRVKQSFFKNILHIHNVPESVRKDTKKVLLHWFVKEMGIIMNKRDIKHCYRIITRSRPRLISVKFQSNFVTELVLSRKSCMWSSRFYIVDELCYDRAKEACRRFRT